MRRVMTIIGTRPEIIKMSRVISAADQAFAHTLVHTGQNYDFELNEVFFNELGVRSPDHFLNAAGTTPIQTISNVIVKVDALLESEKPEAVLIYGDTNSGLACIAAKRRKIPIFHMEAGNRSFDARVPEEINRKIIDHISDINFVLTEHARRYLLTEGCPADRVFKTGSHMPEVLAYAQATILSSTILQQLDLKTDGYFIVSLHREENVDSPAGLKMLMAALERLACDFDLPVIISTHPRTRVRLEALDDWSTSANLRFMPPFGFSDYIALQKNAFCVISDSGTIAEEAALLGFPAVTVRNAHERPEGQDAGAVVLASPSPTAIADAVRVVRLTRHPSFKPKVGDYEVDHVSSIVVRVVSGYIDFVNSKVWSKGQE